MPKKLLKRESLANGDRGRLTRHLGETEAELRRLST
jgi:hypothetical protein